MGDLVAGSDTHSATCGRAARAALRAARRVRSLMRWHSRQARYWRPWVLTACRVLASVNSWPRRHSVLSALMRQIEPEFGLEVLAARERRTRCWGLTHEGCPRAASGVVDGALARVDADADAEGDAASHEEVAVEPELPVGAAVAVAVGAGLPRPAAVGVAGVGVGPEAGALLVGERPDRPMLVGLHVLGLPGEVVALALWVVLLGDQCSHEFRRRAVGLRHELDLAGGCAGAAWAPGQLVGSAQRTDPAPLGRRPGRASVIINGHGRAVCSHWVKAG